MNQAVWDWYIMCRNSNIVVSMLQEEATLITEKLETANFVANNGWLEKFKQKYSICNKMVAGEAGDVSKETMESWNERAREITTGWNARDVWNMDETGCFWRGLPEKTLEAKGRWCTGGKKAKQRLHCNMSIFCKCGRGEGRSCKLLLALPSVLDALKTYSHQAGHTTAPISPIVKLG